MSELDKYNPKHSGERLVSKEREKAAKEILHDEDTVSKMTDDAVHERMALIVTHGPKLTVQEERFVLFIASGMTPASAGRSTGMTAKQSSRLFHKEHIQDALASYRKAQLRAVEFGTEEAHAMYMEAWASSANATEMKNIVDSLTKLHGVAKEQGGTTVNNLTVNVTEEQLKQLSDAELLALVGETDTELAPKKEEGEPFVIDQEPTSE